ncbi:hypothetical protein JCM16358_11650 [Halanaerocella petrolearia]
MTRTKVTDIFKNKVTREINPVEHITERDIKRDVEEFILTDSLEEKLYKFFNNYAEPGETEVVSAWLSGDFGTGKSYFAKMIGYLAAGFTYGDTSARERILDKLYNYKYDLDELFFQLKNIDTEYIPFNINSGLGQSSVNERSPAEVFLQNFFQHLGFSVEPLWIGLLEWELYKKEKLNNFLDEYKNQTGSSIEEQSTLFVKKNIKKVLVEVIEEYKTIEDAEDGIQTLRERVISPETTAKIVNEYIELRKKQDNAPHKRVLFVVDEIGMYVGENTERLIEIQTLEEEFEEQGKGNIWFVALAQEQIRKVKSRLRKQSNRLAKIIDRFKIKMHLTSDNIETIIRERVLDKEARFEPELKKLYNQNSGNLNLINNGLEVHKQTYINYNFNEETFTEFYPYFPFYISIIQNTFLNIRTDYTNIGASSGNARSLISITQGVIKTEENNYQTSNLGRLVPLDEIFEQMAEDMPDDDIRIIRDFNEADKADKNKFLKRILKVVYVLKHNEDVKKNSKNITYLLVNNLDTNINKLKQRVEEGLQLLQNRKYVIKEADEYKFLSSTEKNIEREIDDFHVHISDIRSKVTSWLENLFKNADRINYKGIRVFDIDLELDGKDIKNVESPLKLKVYSPLYMNLEEKTKDEVVTSTNFDETYNYWITNVLAGFREKVERYLSINKIIDKHKKNDNPEVKMIIREKSREAGKLEDKLIEQLEEALVNGEIIYNGNVTELEKTFNGDIEKICQDYFEDFVPRMYPKFSWGKLKVTDDDIKKIFNFKSREQINEYFLDKNDKFNIYTKDEKIDSTNQAIAEVQNYLSNLSHGKTEVQNVMDKFTTPDYGWPEEVIKLIIAVLFREGKVRFKYQGKTYRDYTNSSAQDLFKGKRKIKRLELKYITGDRISPERRRIARELIENLTGNSVIDKVVQISNKIEEYIDELHSDCRTLSYYKEEINFKDTFEEAKRLIKIIKGLEEPEDIINEFLGYEEKIADINSYINNLLEFIGENGGKDKAKKFSSEIKPMLNKSLDTDTTKVDFSGVDIGRFEDCKKNIKAIYESKSVMKRWDDILSNYKEMKEIEDDYNQVLVETKKELYKSLQEDLISEYPNYEDMIRKELNKYTEQKEIGNLYTSDRILVNIERVEDKKEELEEKIIKAEQKSNEDNDKGNENDNVKTEFVDLEDLISTKEVKNQNDVEKIVQEFRNNLSGKLSENSILKLR